MSTLLGEVHSLLNSSVDVATDELIFLSKNLEGNAKALDDLQLEYEKQAEGISLNLVSENTLIFKKKINAVERLGLSDTNKVILVVEDSLVYLPTNPDDTLFFQNIFYWHRLLALFTDKSIAAFNDHLKKHLLFLSDKLGKVDIGYKVRWLDLFYDRDNKLKENYHKLDSLITRNTEFSSFYRDNFIKAAQDIADIDARFTETLKSISHIFELANKDFDLFKSKFSFENFRSDLDKEKEKYLKDYQSTITDFLSKVSTVPIQFGAYIVLLMKFVDEPLPLIATLVLIVFWSTYNWLAVKQLLSNLEHTKVQFNTTFDSLITKAKIDKADISKDRKTVLEKIDSTKLMLKSFNWLVLMFTSICFVYGFFFLSKIFCSNLIIHL
ncbi:MAG: hypothetical protein PHO76_09325 [Methylotenera sp.]|nr:hypothetical protein [Methylotenera sp.]MDD4925566.1 hypothetical protein [Methylotenera sp.]